MPRRTPEETAARLAELRAEGAVIVEQQMAARREAVSEFDGELDPDLEGLGDDVLETDRREWERRWGQNAQESLVLKDPDRPKGGRSRFSVAEQKQAAQRAMDLHVAELISPAQAYDRAGEELGTKGENVRKWAQKHGLLITSSPTPAQLRSNHWNLFRREELFNRQLDVASQLIDRLQVWIQNPADPNIPPGFQAASEFKTIAVGAAIAHDKLTGIEDLKLQRGLRDVDSEELAGEITTTRQRLLEMANAQTITVDPETGEIL